MDLKFVGDFVDKIVICWQNDDTDLVFTYTIDASERQPLLPKIVCDAHL